MCHNYHRLHAVTLPAAARLFITDKAVLCQLYSPTAPDPGLSHWQLSPSANPFTSWPPPPYYAQLHGFPAPVDYMLAVPFDLPAAGKQKQGVVEELYRPPADSPVLTAVLVLVKVPHASRAVVLRDRKRRLVMYQKDVESFSAWLKCDFDKLSLAQQLESVFASPFNPHRFAFDPTNLCSLMPDHSFQGYSSPSWYRKTPGSYFCMHVEQLSAPFYNLCYSGATSWWVVRDEDRELLDRYVIARAREWYGVPANVQLSEVGQEAMRGLLYTKHVVFHPDDLVAAGIRLTQMTQTTGQFVVGSGNAVHLGMTSVLPDQAASEAYSVNEAVNFMPVQWLATGLPLLARWMQWLKTAWLPTQTASGLRGEGKKELRAAMQHWYTNQLVGMHVPAH